MMQVFVKGSKEALELYKKAFNADVLCEYPDGNGGYMHAEINAYGQVIAISEIEEEVNPGNTMMFCFDFGEGGEDRLEERMRYLKKMPLPARRLENAITAHVNLY